MWWHQIPLSLYEWSFTISPMPYNRIKNVLSMSLKENISFLINDYSGTWVGLMMKTPVNHRQVSMYNIAI